MDKNKNKNIIIISGNTVRGVKFPQTTVASENNSRMRSKKNSFGRRHKKPAIGNAYDSRSGELIDSASEVRHGSKLTNDALHEEREEDGGMNMILYESKQATLHSSFEQEQDSLMDGDIDTNPSKDHRMTDMSGQISPRSRSNDPPTESIFRYNSREEMQRKKIIPAAKASKVPYLQKLPDIRTKPPPRRHRNQQVDSETQKMKERNKAE